MNTLTLQPIGVIRSPYQSKAETPRQPRAAEGVTARIELYKGRNLEDAVRDLEEWSHLHLLFWFHLAEGWRPTVQPPRSVKRRGVLATRAPYRPNPLGLSVVKLLRVENLTIHIEEVDLIDGTPILDIKPYLSWADSVPDASSGWLAPIAYTEGRPDDPGPQFRVTFTDRAETRLAWLAERGVDLQDELARRLKIGPQPHAYRRIKLTAHGSIIAIDSWRAHFTVNGEHVEVNNVVTAKRTSGEIEAAFREAFGR